MYSKSLMAKDLTDFSELDEIFHSTLLMHCDNMYLISIARQSCATISKYLMYSKWMSFYSPKEFYERHSIIVDAMIDKDVSKIQLLIREHYNDLGKHMAKIAQTSVCA